MEIRETKNRSLHKPQRERTEKLVRLTFNLHDLAVAVATDSTVVWVKNMGSEMLLAGFVVSKTWDMSDKKVREQRKNAMLAEVETLHLKDLVDFAYQFQEEQSLKKLREKAKEVIEEAMSNLDSREVTTWFWRDVAFYFTGGLSWGDAPTDTYTCFQRFQNLPDKVTRHLL